MLLDVKITGFDALSLTADPAAIAEFKGRNRSKLDDIATFMAGKDNLLDAQSIAAQLFPVGKADVFLSHAHANQDAVISLALALEAAGLTVFVDSCVWGNVYELLLRVDNARSRIEGKEHLFHYRHATRTAANMYMILNVALHRMIDNAELMLFLDTDAVRVEQYLEDKAFIGSPWIFSELMFATMVGRRARPGKSVGLETFTEALAKTFDSALPPLVRYELPPSSHTMEASVLMQLVRDAQRHARLFKSKGQQPEPDVFLEPFYTRLPVTAMERKLLGWPPLAVAQPAR